MKLKRKKSAKPTIINATFVKVTMKWLTLVYYKPWVDLTYINALVDQLFLVLKTRGAPECIKYSKGLRSDITNFVSRTEDLTKLRLLTRREVPRRLRFLRGVKPELVPTYIRLLLTVTYTTRSLTLPPEPDFTSITKEPIKEMDLSLYSALSTGFWKALGHRTIQRRPPSSVRFTRFHLTTKSSPSGGSALSMAIYEVLSGALNPIINEIKIVGGQKLSGILDLLLSLPSVTESKINEDNGISTSSFDLLDLLTSGKWRKRRANIRRLAAIQDKEGKTREVAILDYWSQTALRPLHSYLFRCLKQIPQDCTFEQGSFIYKLRPKPGNNYYSFDLKSATNRFPILLQVILMVPKFGKKYVNAWKNLMVRTPFDYQGNKFSYSTGNPMGAYSSWNSFTLCHHFVIYCCCREIGQDWSIANYVILGDDLVIHDDVLAVKYSRAMVDLGVDINYDKSFLSPHCYEFAKRIIHNGAELTPFPINSIWENRDKPTFAMATIAAEVNKGWIPIDGVPKSTIKFYELRGYPRRFRDKTLKQISVAFAISEAIGKRMTGKECLTHILQSLSFQHLIPLFERAEGYFQGYLNQDIYLRLLRVATYLVFRENFERKVRGTPLGELPERLLLYLTSPDCNLNIQGDQVSDIIQSVPTLGVYGQIEVSYLRILKDTYSLDFFSLGDWSLTMKALCLPLSDEVFYLKPKELKPKVSALLSGAVIHLLTGLNTNANLIWYGTGMCPVSKQELFDSCPRIGDVWFRQD